MVHCPIEFQFIEAQRLWLWFERNRKYLGLNYTVINHTKYNDKTLTKLYLYITHTFPNLCSVRFFVFCFNEWKMWKQEKKIMAQRIMASIHIKTNNHTQIRAYTCKNHRNIQPYCASIPLAMRLSFAFKLIYLNRIALQLFVWFLRHQWNCFFLFWFVDPIRKKKIHSD